MQPWRAPGRLHVWLAGCMTSKVDETRQVAAALHPNEAIVVLKKPQIEGVGTEEDFLDCLQEKLGGELVHPEQGQSAARCRRTIEHSVPIYGEQEFTDAMFPWFEPSTAPANAAGLKTCSQRPGVADRLSEIGVRYVVWLDGNTQEDRRRRQRGLCSRSGRCGLHRHRLVGEAFRLRGVGLGPAVRLEMGTVTTDVKGTSVLIGAIAPIPIISPVRSTACNRLAEQLRSFLVGDDLWRVEAPAGEPRRGRGGRPGTVNRRPALRLRALTSGRSRPRSQSHGSFPEVRKDEPSFETLDPAVARSARHPHACGLLTTSREPELPLLGPAVTVVGVLRSSGSSGSSGRQVGGVAELEPRRAAPVVSNHRSRHRNPVG